VRHSNFTRRVSPKTLDRIVEEWDAIATTRRIQIASGDDISFDHVLAPSLLSVLEGASPESILDAGCGTGAFTALLAPRFKRVVGVDPSRRSLEQASTITDVEFVASSIEGFAKSGRSFASVVANMTMMNVPNIYSAIQAAGALCRPGGVFAFTITHPWFWPFYWNYFNVDWFRYSDEIFIESEFRTSKMESGMITTHIHRPLEMYVEAMEQAGFKVDELREPMPSPIIEARYPEAWKFPRFLLISGIKS
jgi:SAM-dependent methyltransferase